MTAPTARALLLVSGLLLGGAAQAHPFVFHVRERVDALRADFPSLKATFRPGQPTPALLTGLRVPTEGATPRARAEAFLWLNPELVGADAVDFIEANQVSGRTIVRFRPQHAGLPVLDRSVVVTLDDAGNVISLGGDTAPITRFNRATIDEETARLIAQRKVTGAAADAPVALAPSVVRKAVVAFAGVGTEVYEVELSRQPLAEHLVVRIDAHTGEILSVRNRVVH
ncbi:MAG: PepSY domain-containing protein [Myxococcales bacterium]|nr:PepSY domain-containing protein [Myxococcales bacterium]